MLHQRSVKLAVINTILVIVVFVIIIIIFIIIILIIIKHLKHVFEECVQDIGKHRTEKKRNNAGVHLPHRNPYCKLIHTMFQIFHAYGRAHAQHALCNLMSKHATSVKVLQPLSQPCYNRLC
jgi:hypothetical protein